MKLKAIQVLTLINSSMALTFDGGYAVMYNGARVELPKYIDKVVKKTSTTITYDDGSKLIARKVANETKLSASAYHNGRAVFA